VRGRYSELLAEFANKNSLQFDNETNFNRFYGAYSGSRKGFKFEMFIFSSGGKVSVNILQIKLYIPDLPSQIHVVYTNWLSGLCYQLFYNYQILNKFMLFSSKNLEEAKLYLNCDRSNVLLRYLVIIKGLELVEDGLLFSAPLRKLKKFEYLNAVVDHMGNMAEELRG